MDKITKDKINKLLDECVQISQRQTDLLNACFGYLRELICNDEELKRVLTQTIGMTNEEILEYGFDLDEKEFDFDCKYIGKRFVFDIKDQAAELPELVYVDGETGTITCLSVETTDKFEDCYWSIKMDNGDEFSAISGYHLTLL